MQTFFRAKLRFLLSVSFLCANVCAGAQVLARPGWAGSGISVETWWHSAVFYRIAPEGFQDSNGDGVGDLRGVSQRLDYLQSLGVDAVVLETPFAEDGFDDVLSEASKRHIRVLVSLPASDANVTPQARHWLMVGAAGVWLRFGRGEAAVRLSSVVHDVRAAANSVPGGRMVVEDTTADPAIVPAPGAQIVAYALPAVSAHISVAAIRSALTKAQHPPKGSDPLLIQTSGDGAGSLDAEHVALQEKVLAMALLISRPSVALNYGQEIGLVSSLTTKSIMWWTPANVTKPAPPPEAAEAPKPAAPAARADEYGTYVPYVAPKAKKPANAKPDPNELPGYTNGALPAAAKTSVAAADVATQEDDKESLLSLYRRLLQLHRSDPAVKSGTSYTLDLDEQNVLLWVMRAPEGARTGVALFAGGNLSDKRVDFSLKEDVKLMKLKGGPLRVIMASVPANIQYDQITDAAMIAPQSVMLAYLDH